MKIIEVIFKLYVFFRECEIFVLSYSLLALNNKLN